MAFKNQVGGVLTKVKSAEDLQKEDIAYRWFELINAIGRLERRQVFTDGSVLGAAANFVEKLRNLWTATRFYVNKDAVKAVKDMLDECRGGADMEKMSVGHMLEVANQYAEACYAKNLFLKEDALGEEGTALDEKAPEEFVAPAEGAVE